MGSEGLTSVEGSETYSSIATRRRQKRIRQRRFDGFIEEEESLRGREGNYKRKKM